MNPTDPWGGRYREPPALGPALATAMALANSEWLPAKNGSKVHRTAVFGLQPMQGSAFARPVAAHPPPVIGEDVVIGPFATIYAGCEIGAGSRVCPYAHIREGVIIGSGCVIGVGVRIGYDARIGNRVQIMDDTHLSGGTVVGNDTFISVQVLAVNDDRPAGYRWKGVTPVRIGHGVVIGAGARLRPGIAIGDGAVVGMGAVVTRDVDPGTTVKGMPAKPEQPPRDTGAVIAAALADGTVKWEGL